MSAISNLGAGPITPLKQKVENGKKEAVGGASQFPQGHKSTCWGPHGMTTSHVEVSPELHLPPVSFLLLQRRILLGAV